MSMMQSTGKEIEHVEIPDGVKVQAFAWGCWWEVRFIGDTLHYPANRGPVFKRDLVWVLGRTIAADRFAERLKNRYGFKVIGVGDPAFNEGPARAWDEGGGGKHNGYGTQRA
jgi:hypothetical protein